MMDKFIDLIKRDKEIHLMNNFFGINPTSKDFKRFEKFKECLMLRFVDRLTVKEISKRTKVNVDTIYRWINLKQFPFFAQMFKNFIFLGKPKPGWKWLPMNVGFGQTLGGPWIQVPMKIKSFRDVRETVNQLKSLPNSVQRVKGFFDSKSEKRMKLEIFAYLLGFMVGDFGKQKIKKNQRINSRKISLKLTKKRSENLHLGNFLKECVRALGIEMKRYKDQLDKSTGVERFYWESSHSLFLEWIFRICLGLKEKETTTFVPVRMEWLLSAPNYFKKRFIQGLGDSDGSVNIQSNCCSIASYPNTRFVKRLIESLGVKARIDKTPDGEVVSLTPKEAIKIPIFFPNQEISYRYKELKAFMEAKRVKLGHRISEDTKSLIEEYSFKGYRKVEVMRLLIHKHKLAVSFATLSRYFKANL